jgi:hypothetical protein
MRPWRVIAVLAVATAMSCGTGIRDGEGYAYVTQTIGPEGGQIVLQEATLTLKQDCVASPALITLRRHESIAQTGAIGPVFEIQIPTPDTFINDPTIGIATLDSVAIDSKYIIGSLVPLPGNGKWFPDTTQRPSCPPSAVCGDVQIQGFTSPGGALAPDLKTTILDLAIVQQCSSPPSVCPTGQNLACNGNACQLCPTGTCP